MLNTAWNDRAGDQPAREAHRQRCAEDLTPPGRFWDETLHGALSRLAAERLLGPAVVGEAVCEGTLLEPWSGVVVPAVRMRDPLTRAAAGLLRAGERAVLSGSTAVALHGCPAAAERTVHVTVPYDRDPRPGHGLAVHQSWIRESDVVELDGLPVLALDVALTELLCTGPHRVALASVEQAFVLLGEEAERFRVRLAERLSCRRDRRGTRQAAGLLELAWSPPAAEEAHSLRDGA
ncbi:hypothetical protein [Bounagaea algeriensis]